MENVKYQQLQLLQRVLRLQCVIWWAFWPLFSLWKQAHLFSKWFWSWQNGQNIFLFEGLRWGALSGMSLQPASKQRNGLSIFSDLWIMDVELRNGRTYSVDGDWTNNSLQVCSSVLSEPDSFPPLSLSAHRNDVGLLRTPSTTARTKTYDDSSGRGEVCAYCCPSSFLGLHSIRSCYGCILAICLGEVAAGLGAAAPHDLESSLISGDVSTLYCDCGLW